MKLLVYALAIVMVVSGCDDSQPDATDWEAVPPSSVSETEHVISIYGDVPYMSLWLEGNYGTFIVDTGSSLTLVNAAKYGLAPETPFHVNQLRILDTEWNDVLVYSRDMGGTGAPDGLVGMDRLMSVPWYIDYTDKTASFLASSSFAPPDGAVEIPYSIKGGGYFKAAGEYYWLDPNRILVDILIEHEPATCLLDTGASYVVMRQSFYDTLPEMVRPRKGTVSIYTAQGFINVDVEEFSEVSLDDGSLEVQGVDGIVLPDDSFDDIDDETGERVDCYLGGAYLSSFALWFDPLEGRLYLAE